MGQALWARYLESSKEVRDWENGEQPLPEGTDLEARKQELESLSRRLGRPWRTASSGCGRAAREQVLATAVLSLAQIYVDMGEAAKAVRCLKIPKSAC